jgi:hypothetical protein
MHRFYVRESCQSASAIALQDGDGRFHLARATAILPPVGTELEGALPRLGFSILLGASTGRVYRVIFELVDAELQVTMARLQSRLPDFHHPPRGAPSSPHEANGSLASQRVASEFAALRS